MFREKKMGGKVFYGWWIITACFFIGLYISGITFYGFTAFIEPLKQEFGWSYTQISFAASLRGLEMGFFAPLIGFLIDRFGPRKVVTCGLITVSLGLFLMSFAQSLLMFYAAFILISFGAGGCATLVKMSLAANWFTRNVGKAIGIAVSGFGASGLMIPMIVFLIGVFAWRNTVVILALGALIVGFPFVSIIRNRPEECGLSPDGEDPVAVGNRNQTESPEISLRWQDAIKKKAFLLLNFTEFVRMMAVSALATHVMPYCFSRGLGEKPSPSGEDFSNPQG
jgi:sugar phosphate permease